MKTRGGGSFRRGGWGPSHRRAFSLIEVMLGLGLLVMLLGSVFAFTYQLLGARRGIAAGADQARLASVLVDQVDPALATTLALHGVYGSGVVGTWRRRVGAAPRRA